MIKDVQLNPVEEWEDEPDERTEAHGVIEKGKGNMVKALYPYMDHDIEVIRGELMHLLDKSNKSWWYIQTQSGETGYVPANYVVGLEPDEMLIAEEKNKTKHIHHGIWCDGCSMFPIVGTRCSERNPYHNQNI